MSRWASRGRRIKPLGARAGQQRRGKQDVSDGEEDEETEAVEEGISITTARALSSGVIEEGQVTDKDDDDEEEDEDEDDKNEEEDEEEEEEDSNG